MIEPRDDDEDRRLVNSCIRWLVCVLHDDPKPRDSLCALGESLLMPAELLDEAAKGIGVERTFDDSGREMWSFP
jgi:hypothetical protein